MDSTWLTGDPAGMRAYASSLRGFADGIGVLQSSGDADVAAMIFDGPAGNRFDARMRGVSKSMHDLADQLRSVAGTLDGAAGRVEEAQAAERRREAEAASPGKAAAK